MVRDHEAFESRLIHLATGLLGEDEVRAWETKRGATANCWVQYNQPAAAGAELRQGRSGRRSWCAPRRSEHWRRPS